MKNWMIAGLGMTALAAYGVWQGQVGQFDRHVPLDPAARHDDWVPLGTSAASRSPRPMTVKERTDYDRAIRRTADMVNDADAQQLASHFGLQVLNLTWEDTGRYKNSSVGPNISDMTIQVESKASGGAVRCMPVIRKPNFADVSTDIDPRDFTLLVGNQRGAPLKRVSLYDFLADPTRFLTHPNSWLGRHRSLLAPRDERVLVSAQACFLPVPRQGIATFNPVLFNYQSVSGDPAVLTILATREGTSTTIIDNKRDAFREGSAWGQRLFHNSDGTRASLTGRRESDYNADLSQGNNGRAATPGMSMVLLIQVPLKQRMVLDADSSPAAAAQPMEKSFAGRARSVSDVEAAVIGHGVAEGPFTEIDHLAIERDDRFPVRVTVQFYKATSNGIVSAADMEAINRQIESVYTHGSEVGSLVTEGETGRPTEYIGCKVQPGDWWDRFWKRHEENTGDTRDEAMAKLRGLLGYDYEDQPVCTLYLEDLLHRR